MFQYATFYNDYSTTHYLPATVYIVIVIVALAEELLALVWLVIVSLSGTLVSATEMPVSLKPSKTNTNRRITKVIKKISLFTSTSSQYKYII